ncbi:hypothetical protein [Choristoneura rosaceana nucleopolyhedrovirus]|uniref:Uncharacterized protein n=1 Tax=Choristoneura rosaceana nucleopolyhedrovirus TaxID=58094 RepID=S5N9Z8_9ABAC|nr:hypothetical protein [Choristoneura rosaceana nucleopolyhedrovirus]AGR57062.1 hypothetical protein [Choristoneura rosaceana nucleopolyhedrovirus]
MPKNEKLPRHSVKLERPNQFEAAVKKYGKRRKQRDEKKQLVKFNDINQSNSKTIELDQRLKIVYEQQKPSIFNETNVQSFVVAFAHPTYPIKYKKIPHTNILKIYCSKIRVNLLFKNDDLKMLNTLPKASTFRVQINDQQLFKVQNVMYDKEERQLVLSINFSKEQTLELLPQKKCVIYFNILSTAEWSVPEDLLNAFANLPLEPPQNV